MSRFPGRMLWTIAAVAIVVAMAQVAEAQGRRGGRGFGRGGFGGVSPVLLAASEEVQEALKLTDDQKTKIEEVNDQLREDMRDARDDTQGDFQAMREAMEKLNQEAGAKLAEVLEEPQQKRLMGIQIQVNGANTLLDAAVAKEVGVTDEQKSDLEEARDSNMQAMRDAFQDFQDLSDDERREKLQQLRTESDNKLLAVLSSEQKDKYEALKGEAVEIDMSQFRGGFGGRGGGGRGGRDGGGRRNRDNQQDSDDGV